jgi:hypothetical protein
MYEINIIPQRATPSEISIRIRDTVEGLAGESSESSGLESGSDFRSILFPLVSGEECCRCERSHH